VRKIDLEKFLLPLQPFVIPLNGLKAGGSAYKWHADGEFFGDFENTEILSADIDVEAKVEKSGRRIDVDCFIEGVVTVECDRCLSELEMPVDTVAKLRVSFSEESQETEEDGREIVLVQDTDSDLDLNQVVYDYVYLSLPVQRMHPEGECDPSVMKYISREEEVKQSESLEQMPFASLGNLLANK